MKKRSLAAATAALLYATLNLGPQAWAGPPFITDDPEPVEYRHWEVYLGSQVASDDNRGGTVFSGTAPHVEVNYGVLPDVQLHAIVPAVFTHAKGETTQYGLGDIELGVKYRPVHETESMPQIGFFPLVELPTGDEKKDLGEGRVQVFLPVWVQKSWGPWTTYGGGGYWIKRIDGKPGDKNFWEFGWLLQRELNKTVTAGAEVFHSTRENEEQSHNRTGFNLGSIINLSEDHHILVSAGRDFRGDNKFSAYLAYQWTFGPEEAEKK